MGVSSSELARIRHGTPSRESGDGRANWQPQGLGPEAYLFGTSQGSRPEDARKDGYIRGRSRWLVPNPGSWSDSRKINHRDQAVQDSGASFCRCP